MTSLDLTCGCSKDVYAGYKWYMEKYGQGRTIEEMGACGILETCLHIFSCL